MTKLIFDDLKKFVCAMYGKSYMNNVNDVRYASFQEHYVLEQQDDPLERIKGVNLV